MILQTRLVVEEDVVKDREPSFLDHRSAPSETFAEVVYQRLREEMLSGTLPAGARLREVEIAERMRTSQGPVREALARLREQGLIISFPYRGTFVSDISQAQAQDAYAVRVVLERFALQLALPRIGAKEFAVLARDVVVMEKAMKAGDLAGNVARDMRFHRRIYEWSGSPLLLQLWDIVAARIRKFAVVATPPVFSEDVLRGVRSHLPLLERMREGYTPELEAELDRHLSMIWLTSEELEEVASP